MEVSSKQTGRQIELDRLAALAAEVNRTADIAASSPTTTSRLGLQGSSETETQYAERISSIDNFNAAGRYNDAWQRAVDKGIITILDGTPAPEQRTNVNSGLRSVIWRAPPFKTQLLPVGEPVASFPVPPLPIPLPVNPATNEPLIPALPPTGTVMDGAGGPQKPLPPKTPTAPVFISSATFKKGTDKAANARGAKALADAAKKAAAAAKLSPKQSKQLMDNVANAIKNNTTSGKKPLAKPKAPRTAGGKPISRPAGSSTVPVTGGGFPLPNGGNGKLPPGAVSSPSPGCFKDKSGNTFCY